MTLGVCSCLCLCSSPTDDSEEESGRDTPASGSSRQELDDDNKVKKKKTKKKKEKKKKKKEEPEDPEKKAKKKGFGLLRYESDCLIFTRITVSLELKVTKGNLQDKCSDLCQMIPQSVLDAALQLLKAISWKQDYPGSFEMKESRFVIVLIH